MQSFQGTFETRRLSFISAFSICMTEPLNKKHKVCFTNFRILLILVMSVNGEIHNVYILYVIKNAFTIVPREISQTKQIVFNL